MVIAAGPRDELSAAYASIEPGGAGGTSRIVRIKGPALPYDPTYHLLGRFDKIRQQIRRERPDVLEAHSPYLGMLAVVAAGRSAARLRTAFWHADHLGTYLAPRAPRLAEALSGLPRALLAPFDATFVAGRGQAAKLRAAGVRNVEHVPFGVDRAVFRPEARRDDVRARLLEGAAPEAALLVGVGRFAFEKRWDVVLDAFARVRDAMPAVLVLVGDGPERARLERRALPGVRFLGFEPERPKLAALLASADVLVHGCPYETFGLGVAEAVASGLPVVVPDAGGASESADPRSAELYESLDAEACAAAVVRLLARDRALLRAAARDASSRVITPEEHVARVVAVYDAMLRAC
jgi:alpha-1,6-mannosyltransferase